MLYLEEIMETIKKSVLSLDEEQFNKLLDECVQTLDNGGKVIVSGLGKNVAICDKFVGQMLSLGQAAQFMHTNSAVHGDLGMIKKEDIVIILTKSGETVESIYLAEKLLERKVNTWLLSFKKESTLTKMLEKSLILDLEHEGDMWDLVPNNSSSVNLIILQALAINIVKRRNVQLDEFKQNHPGGHIGATLKQLEN